MNAIETWFASHKLSAHITMGSILAGFGTLFTLYTTIPSFQALVQRINSGLPGWAEAIVTAAVGILLFYWKTSSTTIPATFPPSQTVVNVPAKLEPIDPKAVPTTPTPK